MISARDKDVTLDLLDHYALPYRTLSTIGSGHWGMAKEFLQREWALLRLIRDFNPDVVTEIGGVFVAPICKLLGKPSVVFTDSEHVRIDRYLTYPFAGEVCTPACFKRDIGKSHIHYPGYHELAYLHPNYFQPDSAVLDEIGVSAGEPFSVVRFVAWKASHDVGQKGFSSSFKQKIIQTLSRYGKVFISSEGRLPSEFESLSLNVSPIRIHDILAYSSLYLGEGATMATEAGILGTPSIYVSSLVGTMGNFDELVNDYELVYSYQDPAEALQQAVSLLEKDNTKDEWMRRRERMLTEKIDVTNFVCDRLKKYSPRKTGILHRS